MKTLRTICYVCSGYYLLQGLGFMFAAVFTRMIRNMMPASLDDNPVFRIQQDLTSLMERFAPWVLIGVVICLLMALRVKELWKAIPVLAILLFGGGLVWLIAFVQQAKVFNKAIGKSMGDDIPTVFGSFFEVVTGISNWSTVIPVLIPGVLIFIFWWRAQKQARQISPSSMKTVG